METTHQIITKYIDQAVEKAVDKAAEKAADKAVQKYSIETKQHMTDLKTFFSIELGKVAELVGSRTTEERVREIVREEIR